MAYVLEYKSPLCNSSEIYIKKIVYVFEKLHGKLYSWIISGS